MYVIEDEQIQGRLFADGAKYKNRKEVVDQLLNYHSIDFSGTDDNDNELDIYEYLKYHNIKSIKEQLEWVLEYGQWTIHKA